MYEVINYITGQAVATFDTRAEAMQWANAQPLELALSLIVQPASH
jgi:hypothetical protein